MEFRVDGDRGRVGERDYDRSAYGICKRKCAKGLFIEVLYCIGECKECGIC